MTQAARTRISAPPWASSSADGGHGQIKSLFLSGNEKGKRKKPREKSQLLLSFTETSISIDLS